MTNYTEFYYATTLTTGTQAIIPAWGTATADRVKQVKITDLKATCGGTARTLRIVGEGGPYKSIQFTLPADSSHNFTWHTPYPLQAVSSTLETRSVYASASGAGVNIVVTGYVDRNN